MSRSENLIAKRLLVLLIPMRKNLDDNEIRDSFVVVLCHRENQ